MGKKKSRPIVLASISDYRLLPAAIFLAVATAVAAQSAAPYHSVAHQQPEMEEKLATQQLPPAPLAPQPSEETEGPLLIPWRGPAKPIPPTPDAAPVILDIPTTEPVIFVTIDDGHTQSPENAEWLMSRRLPFTLFLDDHDIQNDYGYFARLQQAGMTIQNHTLTHARLSKMPLDQQKAEICGAADHYVNVFGKRPTLLRPPYAMYNDETRQAAYECGMRAIVLWRAYVSGGQIYFQHDKTHFEPGDIVLLHFKEKMIDDLEALTKQVQKDHLRVGKLEDWLK